MNIRLITIGFCLAPLIACAAEMGGPEDEEEADLDVGVVSEGLVTFRNDQTNEMLFEGPFGAWQQTIFCNPGTWVKGFAQRVEAHVGGDFDDTELNSVRLRCANSSGTVTETIMSHDGNYGAWGSSVNCSSGGFVTGARLRVEGSQGSGDDTGANETNMTCSSGTLLEPPAGSSIIYGDWSPWQSCSPGAAVCGISIKWEKNQGSGDDTAMNGMKLVCCKK